MQGKKNNLKTNKSTNQYNQYTTWIFYGLKSVYSEGKVEYTYSFNVNVETQHMSSWSEITEKKKKKKHKMGHLTYFLTRQNKMISCLVFNSSLCTFPF